MGYKDLYSYCQSLSPKISRKQIIPKVLDLTGIEVIRTAYTDAFDETICRGFFVDGVSHRYGSGKFIVVHRNLTYCWKRMVYVKELMHCFDAESEMAGSAESFENLLNDLAIPDLEEETPQIQSESNAVFMALGVLCPEKCRLEYIKKKQDGLISDYSIAVDLRIPEGYIPLLLHPLYEEKIGSLVL